MIVLHSLPLRLPQTSPWMRNQVRFLPATVEAHVAAECTAHLDRFPIARHSGRLPVRLLGYRTREGLLREAGRARVERHFGVRVLAGRLADTYVWTVEGR